MLDSEDTHTQDIIPDMYSREDTNTQIKGK